MRAPLVPSTSRVTWVCPLVTTRRSLVIVVILTYVGAKGLVSSSIDRLGAPPGSLEGASRHSPEGTSRPEKRWSLYGW